MLLEIIQQPNPILREKALKVNKITPALKELIINMLNTMYEKSGVGLAAPQVGHSLRIIVFDETPERNAPKVLINPEIVSSSKKKILGIEGCLSCRGVEMLVERAEKVTVQGQDLDLKPIKFKAEGFLARILQHEINHLDGITIMDIGKPVPPEEKNKPREIVI